MFAGKRILSTLMPPQNNNGVRFENQGEEFGTPPQRSGRFDLVGLLVRKKIVSSVQQAQYVLIGVAVLVLIIAGYLFFHAGGSVPPPPPVSVSSS
jgi:hypothetical protein